MPSFTFDATAGLSLGEFTALAAAETIGFKDGLLVVRRRGELMQDACEASSGGMAAIVGLEEEKVQDFLMGSWLMFISLMEQLMRRPTLVKQILLQEYG